MKITRNNEDGLLVELSGHLNTETAEPTQKEILRQLEGIRHLELDLSELEFISSAGLRVIMFLRKTLVASGGELKVGHVPENVMEVFTVTGLSELVSVSNA